MCDKAQHHHEAKASYAQAAAERLAKADPLAQKRLEAEMHRKIAELRAKTDAK